MKNVNRKQRITGRLRFPLLIILLVSLAMSVLSGCELMPVEEELPAVPIVNEYAGQTYTQTEVLRGDLKLEKTVTCKYGAAIAENYIFDESLAGIKIGAVYVTEGQEVKAGTLLAELDNAGVRSQIADQEKKISAQNLKITHIKENRDLDIRMQSALVAQYRRELSDVQELIQKLAAWEAQENPTEPRPTESTMDKLQKQEKNLQQSVERQQQNKQTVTENYETKVKNAEDTLLILQQRLEELQQTLLSRQLWARMDGVVTHADEVEHHPKASNRSVVIITDMTSMFFQVTGTDTEYFTAGAEHVLLVGETQYNVVVTDPSQIAFPEGTETEGSVYLQIQGEQPIIEENQTGTVTLLLDSRQDVLYVDAAAVKRSGEESYVQILGEDGLKTTQTVTVGLKCDTKIEIVNGLSEGDKVILE